MGGTDDLPRHTLHTLPSADRENENMTFMTEEGSVKSLASAGRHWALPWVVMPAHVCALVLALATEERDHQDTLTKRVEKRAQYLH